jgi:hypothetical protein
VFIIYFYFVDFYSIDLSLFIYCGPLALLLCSELVFYTLCCIYFFCVCVFVCKPLDGQIINVSILTFSIFSGISKTNDLNLSFSDSEIPRVRLFRLFRGTFTRPRVIPSF